MDSTSKTAQRKEPQPENKPTVRTRVVQRKNGLLLAEWMENGVPTRAWVTPDMVEADHGQSAYVKSPKDGIPYGVNFAEFLTVSTLPEQIDAELKRAGIWTFHDVQTNSDTARQAIASAYGINLAELLNAARQYEKRQQEER